MLDLPSEILGLLLGAQLERAIDPDERAGDAGLLERRDALDALVTAQNHAAVGDALAFGSRAIQAPRFDFEREIARIDET